MLCAKYHNDWIVEMDVMDELDLERFEFEMSFGRISYSAQHPKEDSGNKPYPSL